MSTNPELDARRASTDDASRHSTKPFSVQPRLFFGIGTGVLLLVGFAVAQQGHMHFKASLATASAAGPSAADRMLALGPQGEAIAKRSGMWDVTFTNWASPGAAPVTTGGMVAERQMYGPMLQEVLRTVPGTPGTPFTRVDDLTFNHIEGRWHYMSMDTRAPVGLMPAWSLNADPAERVFISFQPFSMPGDGANVTGQMMRMEETITQTDGDHDVKDQYFMPADGAGTKWLAKRYSYTRKPSEGHSK